VSVASTSMAECALHGSGEIWVTCVHTRAIRSARRTTGQPPVVGDALCMTCKLAVDGGAPPAGQLRIACGACVKARWPVEEPT
jgi:hypothetical protein